MEAWQERLAVEEKELDEKIKKLRAFKEGGKFFGLSIRHQDLLIKQLPIMEEYSEILSERISLSSEEG